MAAKKKIWYVTSWDIINHADNRTKTGYDMSFDTSLENVEARQRALNEKFPNRGFHAPTDSLVSVVEHIRGIRETEEGTTGGREFLSPDIKKHVLASPVVLFEGQTYENPPYDFAIPAPKEDTIAYLGFVDIKTPTVSTPYKVVLILPENASDIYEAMEKYHREMFFPASCIIRDDTLIPVKVIDERTKERLLNYKSRSDLRINVMEGTSSTGWIDSSPLKQSDMDKTIALVEDGMPIIVDPTGRFQAYRELIEKLQPEKKKTSAPEI